MASCFPSAFVELGDGSLLVGGAFDRVGGSDAAHLIRLLPDGSVDPDWTLGTDVSVELLMAGPDGFIYATGRFSEFGGQQRIGLARFSIDGNVDATWVPEVPAGATNASAMAFDDSGNALVAFHGAFDGSFARVERISMADGSADPAFVITANSLVQSLAFDSAAGHVLLAGLFSNAGGLARRGFARADATTGIVDDWNPSGTAIVSGERIILDGTHAIVAGSFPSIGGLTTQGLARVSLIDGNADPAWTFNLGGARVTTMRKLSDGSLVFAGGFATVNGSPRPAGIARVASDGSLLAWDPGATTAPANSDAIAVANDGRIVIPRFQVGLRSSHLLWLDPVTAAQAPPTSDVDFDSVTGPWAFVPASDGGLFFTGSTLDVDGRNEFGAHRLALDNQFAPGFAANLHAGTLDSSSPRAIAAGSDAVFVGGFFFNGAAGRGVAKLSATDGTEDIGWVPATTISSVAALAYDEADAQVYVLGSFTANTPSGQVRNLGRFNATTGVIDEGWRPSIQAQGSSGAIALHDGHLYVTETNAIRRYPIDGQGDADLSWQVSLLRSPALLIDPAGGWLIGTDLRRYSLVDGAVDASWDPLQGRGFASGLALGADGSIHARGSFAVGCDGGTMPLIRVLPNTNRLDPTWDPQVDGTIFSLAAASDGTTIIGGQFTSVNGERRRGIAGLGLSDTIFSDGVGDGGGCVRL